MKNSLHENPEVNAIVGKTVGEAKTLLEGSGYTMRIINEDGKPFMVDVDYKEKRVNVFIIDGKVDNIDTIG